MSRGPRRPPPSGPADPAPDEGAADLAPGVTPIELLARDERGASWRVRADDCEAVLRVGPGALTEVAVALRLGHATLPTPFAWGRTPSGRPWCLRDWFPGRHLAQACADVDAARVAGWVREVLGGLAALHAAGFVHRDVKSENVLVQVDAQGDDRVSLMDLDLATRGGRAAPRAGTALHLAPEVLLGAAPTPAADLFSVGVMLALCFCGEPGRDVAERFPGASFWDASGLDPDRLPAELSTLVRALVERQPSARPADALAAQQLIDGTSPAPGGRLGLPFLAGREEALTRLADGVTPEGTLLLITADDPGSVEPLASALALELLLRDLPAGRPGDGGPPASVAVLAASGDDELRLDAATDALAEASFAPRATAGSVVVVTDADGAERLAAPHAETAEADPAGAVPSLPGPRLQTAAWSSVTAETLAERLMQISGGGSPAGCQALAASLMTATDGRWSRIDAALARARDHGVIAGDGTLLLERWPENAWRDGEGVDPVVGERDLDGHLQAGEAARRRGDTSEARAHVRAARRCAGPADAEGDVEGQAAARARLDALEARLDLARGQARRVLEDLRAAHGEDLERAPAALRVVAALAAEQLGERDAARRLHARLADDGVEPEAAFGRMGLAHALLLDGDAEGALALAGSPEPASSPVEVRVARGNIAGLACLRLGRADEARARYEAARDAAAAAEEPASEARCELNLAALQRAGGDLEAAVARLRRAEALFERAGHLPGRALALNNLGTLLRDRGELAAARQVLSRAVMLRRRAGDSLGAAGSLGSLAFTFLDAGEVGQGLALLARADAALEAGGYGDERGLLALRRAGALALAGRAAGSAALLEGEITRAARARRPALTARMQGLLAAVRGKADEARRAWDAGLDAAADEPGHPEGGRCAAWLLALDPEHGRARAVLEEWARASSPDVRAAEAHWRLARRDDELDPARLDAWCETFDRAGRTDLLRAACLARARWARRDGDAAGRRAATARAVAAAEALVGGLGAVAPADGRPTDPNTEEQIVDRITALAGGPVTAAVDGALDVGWYLDCSRRLAAETDLQGLLGAIVDAALELVGARRGLLMLMDAKDLEVEVARGPGGHAMPDEDARFSRTLVRRALDEGQPLVITDAARDERFVSSRSISNLDLRSVMCVPFTAADGLRGALYMDDQAEAGVFDGSDVAGVRALADQAAIAINNLRHRSEIEALNRRLAERVESQQEELVAVRSAWRRRGDVAPVGGLVGESEAMREVYRQVERFGPTDLPVLVTGPSGTGKDVVARALHEHSGRSAGPLVVENVAALPAQLLESEMFGHVRGAFTGADRDRPGLFAEADGGTFVLDEIGEMPLELQAKLLRVLESGEYRPVGARRTLRADVRIVAVTNRDLAARVSEGEFREDLFYRLNAAEVRMPPLSGRLDDIALLVRHFVSQLDARQGGAKPVAEEVMAAFMRRPWPGNVRELSNEVARVYVLSGPALDDPDLVRPPPSVRPVGGDDVMPESLKLEDVERAALQRALKASGGRKDRAAELLGISRAGLYAKLKRLALDDEG